MPAFRQVCGKYLCCMKKIFFVFSILFYCGICKAQKIKRTSFNSYNAVGLIIGQSENSMSLETVNGITLGNWFAGAGFAYDAYRYKTIPVFIDIKYHFANNKDWFVQTDVGYNIPAIVKSAEDKLFYSVQYTGGIFLQSGVGYLFLHKKNYNAYCTINAGLKKITRNTGLLYRDDSPPYNEMIVQYKGYQYELKTISIKAGIQF